VPDQRCVQCQELGPELAMGLVTGQERATALAHLQDCADCREHLAALTRLHDRLRGLIPPAEPPVGFETAVLARLGHRPAWARTPGRRLALAAGSVLAAAGLLVAAFVGGWTARGASGAARPPVVSAPVLTASLRQDHREVGRLFLDRGNRPWLSVYLEAPDDRAPFTCTLLRADGTVAGRAPVPVVGDDAYWGGPVADPAEITVVRISDATGATVAIARLPGP
jgi:hypothetical protein